MNQETMAIWNLVPHLVYICLLYYINTYTHSHTCIVCISPAGSVPPHLSFHNIFLYISLQHKKSLKYKKIKPFSTGSRKSPITCFTSFLQQNYSFLFKKSSFWFSAINNLPIPGYTAHDSISPKTTFWYWLHLNTFLFFSLSVLSTIFTLLVLLALKLFYCLYLVFLKTLNEWTLNDCFWAHLLWCLYMLQY